ncbi:MAG: hypothetical protein LUQ20_07560 [Candidatus Methanoperedens sp.]|jgi:hypothetical protein|nr:hypothetical protein [Candidatus Methanoperedens sp.]
MALGLPVKMVVLTIVGMVGLAAMLVFINNSEAAIPKPMHANINGSSLIILSESPDLIELPVEVINSKDGTPVEKASAALSGMSAASINITDSRGDTVLKFNKSDLELTAQEGYLKLTVRAAGFREYENEFAVKVVN